MPKKLVNSAYFREQRRKKGKILKKDQKPSIPLKEIISSTSILSEMEINLPEEVKEKFISLHDSLSQIARKDLKKTLQGAPSTQYDQRYCIIVMEEMAKGKAKDTVATELGIWLPLWKYWEKTKTEFFFASQIGSQLCMRWWMEQGRLNIHNKGFNHQLWMNNMTNLFRWSNKLEASIENTERKILEVKVENNSDESAAEILRILFENGGIKSSPENPSGTEIQ